MDRGGREGARPHPRRASAAGANVSLQDGEVEVMEVQGASRVAHPGPDRLGAAIGGLNERRNSATQPMYQRHMPREPLKFHIPRKTKEKRALSHYVSTESREYEDMLTVLTSCYLETSSSGSFTYCKPRLIHSELLEKEFVEKRKEMKGDGRTEKELEESYCFLLTDPVKLPLLCEKGLFVGQSWVTVLGNPSKGVYLSKYSDLLQINGISPGFTGELLIFKVMKGKVKSIYDNIKTLGDPTPRFDSHISKNASKVTSLTSYRAFELTQQYFYEYEFDELRQRPRQVCPYAVVSFTFKAKDSALPSKPLAPIRLNSQSAEGSKERAHFTVWSGDLVRGDQVLYQMCLRSFSPPLLPQRLPEKLEIGCLMRLQQVTKMIPSDLFSYNLYSSSQEVVKGGFCCSLLEVTDRIRSTTSVKTLLHELEIKRVVLVTPLTDKGFLFILSSVQMATPDERGETWSRCLQALFISPETKDVASYTSRYASSSRDASMSSMPVAAMIPGLNQFLPALHHALVKARANPPPELSAGVERQARDYLIGLNEGKVRKYPMGEYDSNMDEPGKPFPAPKHHRLNMDGYLKSYVYSPVHYMLSVARARGMVEGHGCPKEAQGGTGRKSLVDPRVKADKEVTSNSTGDQTNKQKMQQLIDMILTCKRNAENEVTREEGGGGGGVAVKVPGRKRRREQETAERAIKYLKASQDHGRHSNVPVEGSPVPGSPGSLASVIGSVGLKDVDLREDGSQLAARLLGLLTGLNQAARGKASQSHSEVVEEVQAESSPFDHLATKLGLPTNCDIDLRKQDELEEQTAGSVSSLEGFSPSDHSGENHHGRVRGRRAGTYEEEEDADRVPWVLIPITGLCAERYTQRDRNLPQDPRFQHFTTATTSSILNSMATSIIFSPTTKPLRKKKKRSPSVSPRTGTPPSPFQCLQSPMEPSSPPPSPDPSPPHSPSQCPSPQPSPPASPSQCPSPEPSPPPSPQPKRAPPPNRDPRTANKAKVVGAVTVATPKPPREIAVSQDRVGETQVKDRVPRTANKMVALTVAPTPPREIAVSQNREEEPRCKETKIEEPPMPESTQPLNPPDRVTNVPPPQPLSTEQETEGHTQVVTVKEVQPELLEAEKEPQSAVENVPNGMEEDVVMEDKNSEVVEMMIVEESDEEKQTIEQVKEVVEPSSCSPSIPSPPPPHHPIRTIDNIVNHHLGDFSSEMQLLLREENIHLSLPQSPHSTSHTETPTSAPLFPQNILPYTPMSQFSQYVSFYSPCPPVHHYVSSLHDSINSLLSKFEEDCPIPKTATKRTNTDTALACKISDFVSGIRASNTTTNREDDGNCSEVTTNSPLSYSPAVIRGAEVHRSPHTITKHCPVATNNNRNAPTSSRVTLSVTTSAASGSVFKPSSNTCVHFPSRNVSPPAPTQWRTQHSHLHSTQTTDSSPPRTVHFTPAAVESASKNPANTNIAITLQGLRDVSKNVKEPLKPTQPSESVPVSVSDPGPVSVPSPPVTAISSLISQLQPEVFNNLLEIIKDVKKNSPQFYLHGTEAEDPVFDDVKEHLLKQGNVEQSPEAFLNQENSDNKLLVIIKNQDIAAHIHKIPGLMSLKRHPSVVFMGIDTPDDVRNSSHNELFVSGGCIVSDELILNPDFISTDRLTALLRFMEEHSSPESLWRWKVHCKTHKKLKEQARFRRDAATLLDVLSAYQKHQIVEFLPYHNCDMMNRQSPDLECLKELQARYAQYRHTIFLTERPCENFSAYSNVGIIVAGIDEVLHDFTTLVGCHDIKDKQPIIDEMMSPEGLGRQLSQGDSVSGSERSPSIFSSPLHPLCSGDHPPVPLSACSLAPLSHLSDQLVPDASGTPQHSDFEILRQAISQLRAEREQQIQQQQQQLQRLDAQAESSLHALKNIHTPPSAPVPASAPARTVTRQTTSPRRLGPGRPTENSIKTVAATLEFIQSALNSESEEERRKMAEAHMATDRHTGAGDCGDHRDTTPVRVVRLVTGHSAPTNSITSITASSNQNTAAATVTGNQTDSANDGRDKKVLQEERVFPKAAQQAAVPSSSTARPLEGDRSSSVTPSLPLDRTIKTEEEEEKETPPPCSSAVATPSVAKVIGTIVKEKEEPKAVPRPALPRLQRTQQLLSNSPQHTQQQQLLSNSPQHIQAHISNSPQHIQQHISNSPQHIQQHISNSPQHIQQHISNSPQHIQQHLSNSPQHLQHLSNPQQRALRLTMPHHIPRLAQQPNFTHGQGHFMGGIRSLLGPSPVWPRGMAPTVNPMLWGFQQAAREFPRPSLLGGYPNPAAQGNIRFRGGQRGGGGGL